MNTIRQSVNYYKGYDDALDEKKVWFAQLGVEGDPNRYFRGVGRTKKEALDNLISLLYKGASDYNIVRGMLGGRL